VSGKSQTFIANRYQLLDKLGQGGMGAVYKAQDRLTNQTIALKQVLLAPADLDFASRADLDTDLHIALAKEFRTLASLRHPNIISVLDYGFGNGRQPHYTMDYLDSGKTIIEASIALTLEEKVTLILQMLLALAYLHRRNIIHRDLKPGNVIVFEGRVKVLDFGLAILRRESDPSRTDTAAGTIGYIAPEIFEGRVASESADLYAVGVMAYELFAGRHPFDTSNMMMLMRQVMLEEADVSILELPPELADVLERLLVKNPDERYNDANDVIRELCAATHLSLPSETAEIRDSFIQAAKFVGRNTELQVLENVLASALEGQGSLYLVGGESGIGKTRLLQELRIQALVKGVLVLHGQAIAEGGSPYHLWRNVLRAMVLYTQLSDEETSVLKGLVPDISDLVGRNVLDAPTLDTPQETQDRLLNVIESVFRKQTKPIMLMLEDLQWADESLVILQRLSHIAKELPLLIIGNYRDDERPDLPNTLTESDVLLLDRFTQENIAELSLSMLGDGGKLPHVVELLQRESEGNVFFLIEVVRALAEEAGKLDNIGSMKLPERVLAQGVQTIVERRLNQVSDDAHALLQLAAIAGRRLDLDILKHLINTQKNTFSIDDWLTTCANVSILDFQENDWRFNHDKLREYLLEHLPIKERPALYRQVAEAVEALYSESSNYYATLTQLWREAGDDTKELHYAALGGKQAFENNNYTVARDLLTRSLELLRALPETPDNLNRQWDLQVPLALALRDTRGYISPEFQEATNRAWELLPLIGETAETLARSQVLFMKWVYHVVAADFQTAWTIARQFYELADKTQNSQFMMEGHRLILSSAFYTGDLKIVQSHLEQILKLYDFEQHSHQAIRRYGQDPGISSLVYSSLPIWILG
jgi:eukaryotic-like serine/threonine-protein kinase